MAQIHDVRYLIHCMHQILQCNAPAYDDDNRPWEGLEFSVFYYFFAKTKVVVRSAPELSLKLSVTGFHQCFPTETAMHQRLSNDSSCCTTTNHLKELYLRIQRDSDYPFPQCISPFLRTGYGSYLPFHFLNQFVGPNSWSWTGGPAQVVCIKPFNTTWCLNFIRVAFNSHHLSCHYMSWIGVNFNRGCCTSLVITHQKS